MSNKITIITKTIIEVLFILGIITILSLPYTLKLYGKYVDAVVTNNLFTMIMLIAICGIFALIILWHLRKMLGTVVEGDCFVEANVTSLKRMSISAFGIAIMMLIRCIFISPTLAAAAMVLTFAMAGLFSRVLAIVFEKAVEYKLENDLTI